MIATGIVLTIPQWGYLARELVFYIKMVLVLVLVLGLVINSFVIEHLSHYATDYVFAELPKERKDILLSSGILSVACWVGAAALSFLFL